MKASILISTFNHDTLLDKTLASIFVQTVPFEYEIILIDDGTNDTTQEVLQKYAHHPQLKVHRIEREAKHRNPSVPRNISIALSRGEVLIMQSDDVIHVTPNTIQKLVQLVDENPDAAVFAQVINVDANGNHRDFYTHPRRKRNPFFFLGAIRREHVVAVGGNDEDFVLPNYDDTWLGECLKNGRNCRLMFMYEPIGYHQDHERTPERYGPAFSGKEGWAKDPMRAVFKNKVKAAQQDPSLWKAWKSSLYDKNQEHSQETHNE
jgi:glycosyltransferase involved in cell wall biosynthesis